MDNIDFSDRTIAANEWQQVDSDSENDELDSRVLVVAADSPLEFLAGPLDRLERIVVTSSDFNDGRFFSIGRQIRLLGYRGRLTVAGNVLPDQFTALRSCGFDDALILDNFTSARGVALDQAHTLAPAGGSVTRKRKRKISTGNRQ